MNMTPTEVLNNIFDFDSFRGLQEDVINHVVDGGDALALFPTGSGKSLCYQIPAICRTGVGVVISPLIALMQDQLEFLEFHGVGAAALNSTLTKREAQWVMDEVAAGEIDLLYVTPERMANPSFLRFLKGVDVSLFAVDEAHCVSQWGHDFRPDYKSLSLLKVQFPGVPRIALTATADAETQSDIVNSLDMADARIFKTSFDRPNLSFSIAPRGKKPKDTVLKFLERNEGASGIVYCMGRKTVEKTAEWLRSEGYNALPYHAGMLQSDRTDNQNDFLNGSVDILVATVAFGMGIDKSDVRFVVHMDLPSSVEAWYQEVGRAGRDGEPAETLMLYGAGDVSKRRRMIHKSGLGIPAKRVEYAKFDALIGLCETVDCRRKAVLSYFGETHQGGCGHCDRCQEAPSVREGIDEAKTVVALLEASRGHHEAFDVVSWLTDSPSRLTCEDETLRKSAASFGYDDNQWASIIRQMVASGILSVDLADRARLTVSQNAQEILQGGTFALTPEQNAIVVSAKKVGSGFPSKKARTSRTTTKSRSAGAGYAPRKSRPHHAPYTGTPLLKALRKTRDRIARKNGVKKYFVIHDSALKIMSDTKPRNGTELMSVKGVGQATLDRYGSEFLSVIAEYA